MTLYWQSSFRSILPLFRDIISELLFPERPLFTPQFYSPKVQQCSLWTRLMVLETIAYPLPRAKLDHSLYKGRPNYFRTFQTICHSYINFTGGRTDWRIYISAADSKSIFIQILVMASERQAHNVTEWIIALQGHPRSSMLVPIESACTYSY